MTRHRYSALRVKLVWQFYAENVLSLKPVWQRVTGSKTDSSPLVDRY